MAEPDSNPNDWAIDDNKEDLVFPPIDHENLKIVSADSDSPVTPSSESSSPSRSTFNPHLRGWISISLRMLRSKICSFTNRAPIWSIGFPAAALLMSCWIIITLRKKRSLTSNEVRLINIIKDKDRKIAQLLHQIAQMNEILIDRHKALAAKVVQ